MSNIGAILRMLGPLLQLVCLTMLFRSGPGATILGQPVVRAAWAGVLFGLVLSATGVGLSRLRKRVKHDPIDRPLKIR